MSRWTETDDQVIRDMAAQKKTAAGIAAVLGVSRNSVIGRAHRQLIALNKDANAEARHQAFLERKAAQPVRTKKVTLPKLVKPAAPKKTPTPTAFVPVLPVARIVVVEPVKPDGPGVSFDELTARSCRYALGPVKAAPTRFCGHETPVGSAWCSYHRAVVYQPKPPRKIDTRPFGFARPVTNARILDAAE